MKILNLAVVGAGLVGRAHIDRIGQHAQCRLSAIADPASESIELAASLDVPRCAGLTEMLDLRTSGIQMDGVILATPNDQHVKQALLCLDHGIPALVEKPVAHTLEEADRLLQADEQSSVPLMVGHHRMHSSVMQAAKVTITSGELGELVAVTGSALFYKPDAYFEAGPWRTQPGGGPILINMIHEIGNLRYLCGEITSVQATASNLRRGYAVEDTVSIIMTFASGAVGTFVLSDTAASPQSWEQTSGENPDYASYSDHDCYHIAGTRGSLSVPTMQMSVFPDDKRRSWYEPFKQYTVPTEHADPLVRQLDHMCAVIRGESRPLVTVRDGYQNLRVTEAIVKAADTRTAVNLD